MLHRLASEDPRLLIAMVVGIGFSVGGLYTFIAGLFEGRRTRITTAAALRQDQHTTARRRWLRRMQRQFRRAA